MDVDKSKYEKSFETISYAGQSKSESMEVIRAAKQFDFDGAEVHLKKAKEFLIKSHQIQTDLIFEESKGNSVEVDIILVHAQDHLSMAQTMYDLSEEIVDVYKTIIKYCKGGH